MTPQEKIEIIEESDIQLCDHCLGRQFARLGHGLENYERSKIIRKKLESDEKLKEEDFSKENVPEGKVIKKPCSLCNGLFDKIDRYAQLVIDAVERYEFNTFLLGCKLPSDVVKNEEEIWEKFGLHYTERIKSEINRLIGKRCEKIFEGSEVDFKRPDINPIVDLEQERVLLEINSLFIYGEYNKYERGIPQTKWLCNNCHGSGCDECNWTGKQYQESVEELIAEPVIQETRGIESKFHGQGREDIDARCLGRRPFVLEILEPEKRNLDLDQLQEKINKSNEDKVEVFDLRFSDKEKVQEIKGKRSDKVYKITISVENEVDQLNLDNLNQLKGTIRQKTPTRVEHRRAGKTRKRDVKEIKWNKVDNKKLELEIRGEAGLYIKELVTGDKEKTKPNVGQVLDTEVEWEKLDVTRVVK